MAVPRGTALNWEGCANVRDLGGHPTRAGRTTRTGAVVRADARERLTERGWAALRDYDVATIVDLRDRSERGSSPAQPAGIDVVEVPVLDLADGEFWGEGRWRGKHHSADFYVAVLERWPERFARAVVRIARARPGAVLVHCQSGRDRTGMIVASLLALVGVPASSIAADYARSRECLQPLYDGWSRDAPDEAERDRILQANVSNAADMHAVLRRLDLAAHLRAHGVADADVARLRARLIG
jgi:protein tyrosine/serine phosphatase